MTRSCGAAQGVVTVTDLSADQVDAMAGGPALRGQALAFGIVRNAKALQRGMARLLEALQQVAAVRVPPCVSRGRPAEAPSSRVPGRHADHPV